jgi:glycosyltransferase involved in cell wall biosynthesis
VSRHPQRAMRIYGSLRSAHLERFPRMVPAEVVFHRTRADHDASLADPAAAPRQAGRLGVVARLLRRHYDVIEVNEPVMVQRWPDLLAQIAAIRLRGVLTRRRGSVVAYCIGLTDPVEELSRRSRLPPRLSRPIARVVMRVLVAGMDRLAFGTTEARGLYARYVPAARLDRISKVFEALPAPCECLSGAGHRQPSTVVFLGAFDERKGIERLMPAWEELLRRDGDARLQLIGSGPLAGEVGEWASQRAEVTLAIDPPRAAIHGALRESTALVLLSQRVGPWREQVGLPIVEALGHGCEVIASSETGLATWLAEHGHAVVDPRIAPAELAEVIAEVLDAPRSRERVLADLPDSDQRIAADAWLMTGDEARAGGW